MWSMLLFLCKLLCKIYSLEMNKFFAKKQKSLASYTKICYTSLAY